MILKIWPVPTEKPRIKNIAYRPGAKLGSYLKGIDLKGKKVIVSGKLVESMDYVPKRSDEIIVANEIRGPLLPVLVFIGHVIWVAALAHPFIALGFILTSAYSIFSVLTQPRLPSFTGGSGIDQSSPTYTWEGGRTIQEVGVPVPITYGIHKLWGNIINQYQSTDGDKNYIHLLLLLCEGEMCHITNVKVNDVAIEEYQDATYEVRLGTNDQAPIDGFAELHDLNDINLQLQYNQPFIYETNKDDVEAIEIYFSFPNGLYQQQSS